MGPDRFGPERLRTELVWGRIDPIPTETSTIVKCRNGNNDDGNGLEIPEIKKNFDRKFK